MFASARYVESTHISSQAESRIRGGTEELGKTRSSTLRTTRDIRVHPRGGFRADPPLGVGSVLKTHDDGPNTVEFTRTSISILRT